MIEGKNLGNKKINRVNLSVTNKINHKLNRLAAACNMRPTSLATHILETCLNDPNFVVRLQEDLNVYQPYKIVPVQNKGEIDYIIKG